jgi:predicted RNase H-like HicB family nuclease
MLKIEIEREEDGRWIAEVPALPGVLAYGETEAQARARAVSLALRVIADRIDNGEPLPGKAGRRLHSATMRSISTMAPSARFVTPTVVREG